MMNYLQLIPKINQSDSSTGTPTNNAQTSSDAIEEEQLKEESNSQDWERWITFQAHLYKRHENRLWFLRDKVQDIQAFGSQTAMVMEQVMDFIFEDLNSWRRNIANLVVPMAQCLKDANFNLYQMMEVLERLHNEQQALIERNNYPKGHLDTVNKCRNNLRDEIKKLKDTNK